MTRLRVLRSSGRSTGTGILSNWRMKRKSPLTGFCIPMNKIRVGIIGAGYIGSVHAANLARDERVRVAAILDVDGARAEKLARTHDAAVAAGASDVIGRC